MSTKPIIETARNYALDIVATGMQSMDEITDMNTKLKLAGLVLNEKEGDWMQEAIYESINFKESAQSLVNLMISKDGDYEIEKDRTRELCCSLIAGALIYIEDSCDVILQAAQIELSADRDNRKADFDEVN